MNRTLLAALGIFGLTVGLAAAGVYFSLSRSVTIFADGERRVIRTRAATAGDALRDAGLFPFPEDIVFVSQPEAELPATADDPLRLPIADGATITLQRAALVRVEWPEGARLVRTHSTDPAAILGQAGVPLSPSDEVWADGVRADGGPLPAAPRAIRLRRPAAIAILEDGQSRPAATTAATVGEALWALGYRLARADVVQPGLDSPIVPGMVITLQLARAITLQADGQTLAARTRQATVGAALAEAGVPLVGLDYSIPDADQPLPADGAIRVVRVRETVLTEQEAIPFETVYQPMAEWDIDTVQTLEAGAAGARRRAVRLRYEDGAEVAREVEAEFVALAPVQRVIGYGTRITVRTIDTPNGPLEYWRAYTMYATSYSASRAGVPRTARNFGITASGKPLVKGLVAIDRRYIPFGTRMYVPGYGLAEAADTGGGVKGRWIDLGYDDWNYVSWSQIVTVYFLTPIPPAGQIVWIIPPTVP